MKAPDKVMTRLCQPSLAVALAVEHLEPAFSGTINIA
jgi:hypothetical protein